MNNCVRVTTNLVPPVARIAAISLTRTTTRQTLQRLLQLAKVTDRKGAWVGGSTYLVILGLTDDRTSTSWLLALKAQAQVAQGEVFLVLDLTHLFRAGLDGQLMACSCNAAIQIGNWLFSYRDLSPAISQAYKIDSLNYYVRNFLLGPAGGGWQPTASVMYQEALRPRYDWAIKGGHATRCSLAGRTNTLWGAEHQVTAGQPGLTRVCDGHLYTLGSATGQTLVAMEITDDRKVRRLTSAR
jgi:hypothetical protein